MIAPALEGAPPEDRKVLYQLALDDAKRSNKVTADELSAWLDSRAGQLWTLHASLRDQYPSEFGTPEATEATMARAEEEQWQRVLEARDQANGFGPFGPPTGPVSRTPAAENPSPVGP